MLRRILDPLVPGKRQRKTETHRRKTVKEIWIELGLMDRVGVKSVRLVCG